MYRFLARLPRHGHFHASVMADDESVRQLIDRDDKTEFGLSGWTHERELLTTIVDSLAQIHATLIQVNSEDGKRPPVDPMPRPTTALDRVERRRSIDEHRARVRLLRPVE